MNAKRGYVPEDDRNFSPEAVSTLKTASRHVIYLINEGYDLKQATVFAGNHFMLSERQRLSIMRSVATRQQLTDRKEKQVSFDDLSGSTISSKALSLKVYPHKSVNPAGSTIL